MKSKLKIIPIIVLVILLSSEMSWITQSYESTKMGIYGLSYDKNLATIKFKLQIQQPTNCTIVVTPMQKTPIDLPIYVYYDKKYPQVGTRNIFPIRIYQQLKHQLALTDYKPDIKVINAIELEDTFSKKEKAIIIIDSGGFPSNVFSQDKNLVKPWIDSGGILIWFGWIPGYYSVRPYTEPADYLGKQGAQMLGLVELFEDRPIEQQPVFADHDTEISKILDISYNFIQLGALENKVIDAGGLILGKSTTETGEIRNSVVVIPIGQGKVIKFGFFTADDLVTNGPEFSAKEITNILLSGILETNSVSNVWYKNYDLENKITEDTAIINLDSSTTGFMVYSYNNINSKGLFSFRQYLALN